MGSLVSKLFLMKKFLFVLVFWMLVISWCWGNKDIKNSELILWASVRNIKRWMSIEDVKKSEWIKEKDIFMEGDGNFAIFTELLWDKYDLTYRFSDNKLTDLVYSLIDDRYKLNTKWWPLYLKYLGLKGILEEKYWSGENKIDELRLWNNNSGKYQDYWYYVSNGDLILRQERSTEDTQIVLTATPVNKTTFWLFVMYWDKKFLKRIEKDKKQQTLNAL